jgi:hypothetical protein
MSLLSFFRARAATMTIRTTWSDTPSTTATRLPLAPLARAPFGILSEDPLTQAEGGDRLLSPLRHFQGESYRFAIPNMRITTERAVELVETGAIDAVDIALLQAICRLNYANALQLMQLVRARAARPESIPGVNEIQIRLLRLTNLGFARLAHFYRADGRKAPHLAYALGYHGVGLLRKRGEWAPNLDRQAWESVTNIKRLLAAHQVTAGFVAEQPAEAKLAVHRRIQLTAPTTTAVHPTVVLEGSDGLWLVESILQSPDWEADFAGKLFRYAAVLSNPTTWQYPAPHAPTLVIVGEGPEHLHRIQSMVQACGAMDGLPVLYTAPRLLNRPDMPMFFTRIDDNVLELTGPGSDSCSAV